MNNYKFLFSGGGTGGHVYPNIAIYEALKEKYPDAEFLYVGTKRGSEASIVPTLSQPIKFVTVPARGLPQNLRSLGAVFSLATIVLGAVKSFFILRKFRPHIVIGSGGYVAAPVLLAAALLKRKVFLHEQNAVPGRLNLFSARFADKIGVSFPASADYFDAEKVVHTGYPLRKAILSNEERNLRGQFNIPEKSRVLFICSGSMGARTINRAAAQIMPRLLALPDLFIVLSTGKAYGKGYKAYDDTVKILESQGLPPEISGRLLVREYFDNIAEIYALADLVACRAGAGTLKEITARGLPSILIPKLDLPGDHQILNAREMEKSGGARVLFEEIDGLGKGGEIILDNAVLFNSIQDLFSGDEPLAVMRKNLGRQKPQDSTALIVGAIEAIIEKKSSNREQDVRIFYLQSLEEEKNIELPFATTTVGNTFWVDIPLENLAGKTRFEIQMLDADENRALLRRRSGHVKVNEKDIAAWTELRADDRIAIDGRIYIFKTYWEKTREIPINMHPGQTASGSFWAGMASRLAALGQVIFTAAIFGAGRAIDIFSSLFAVILFLRRLLVDTALKISFPAIFARLLRRGPRKKAWEYSSTITNLALLFSLLASAAGVFFAAQWIPILLPGFVVGGLLADAVAMARILFPSLLLIALAAVMNTQLKTFARNGIAAISPIFFFLGSMLGITLFLPAGGIQALGYGVLSGGLLQIIFLLPFLRKTWRRPELEFSYRPSLKLKSVPLRKTYAQTASLCTDDFFRQSASVFEKLLGSTLRSGSLSYLYFAMAVFRLPFVAISRSIDNLLWKDFSQKSALLEKDKIRTLFINGIRVNLFLLAPVSILAITLANPLVSLLLERFHFSALAVTHTTLALQFYAIGLIGWGLLSLTARFFAAGLDDRSTSFFSFLMLALHVTLAAVLIKTPLKFAGIALATSISTLLLAFVRIMLLQSRLNRDGMPVKSSEIISAMGKTLSACLLMVIAIVEAKYIFNRIHFNSRALENIILCVSLSFIGTAVYFLSSLIFKNSGILVFKKKDARIRRATPISLLSPFRFMEVVSANPDFFKAEYGYKVNLYLSHPAWEIKNIGIKLIGLFKDKSKCLYLVSWLSAGKGNGFMRRNALLALKALNYWNPQVKELMLRLLKDGYYEVRATALEILGKNISESEYADLKKLIARKLRHGKIEEKTACLRLIARKGSTDDLAQLSRLYLDGNSLIREETLEVLYAFFRRGLLSGAELKQHMQQVLITSNHLVAEFRIKSVIQRIAREIDQT